VLSEISKPLQNALQMSLLTQLKVLPTGIMLLMLVGDLSFLGD
jgi:hypothetical protein